MPSIHFVEQRHNLDNPPKPIYGTSKFQRYPKHGVQLQLSHELLQLKVNILIPSFQMLDYFKEIDYLLEFLNSCMSHIPARDKTNPWIGSTLIPWTRDFSDEQLV
jgi:hypothetical protein